MARGALLPAANRPAAQPPPRRPTTAPSLNRSSPGADPPVQSLGVWSRTPVLHWVWFSLGWYLKPPAPSDSFLHMSGHCKKFNYPQPPTPSHRPQHTHRPRPRRCCSTARFGTASPSRSTTSRASVRHPPTPASATPRRWSRWWSDGRGVWGCKYPAQTRAMRVCAFGEPSMRDGAGQRWPSGGGRRVVPVGRGDKAMGRRA